MVRHRDKGELIAGLLIANIAEVNAKMPQSSVKLYKCIGTQRFASLLA
jgi:hypothetical protein